MSSCYAEQKETFNVHGPDSLKKGETGIFMFTYEPLRDSADVTVRLCEIIRPDGSTITRELSLRIFGFVGSGIQVVGYKATFTPTQHGTHFISMEFYNSTALEYYYGVKAFHVPLWVDNIDAPVSDINKHATEISRLRTTVKKHGSDRSILG